MAMRRAVMAAVLMCGCSKPDYGGHATPAAEGSSITDASTEAKPAAPVQAAPPPSSWDEPLPQYARAFFDFPGEIAGLRVSTLLAVGEPIGRPTSSFIGTYGDGKLRLSCNLEDTEMHCDRDDISLNANGIHICYFPPDGSVRSTMHTVARWVDKAGACMLGARPDAGLETAEDMGGAIGDAIGKTRNLSAADMSAEQYRLHRAWIETARRAVVPYK